MPLVSVNRLTASADGSDLSSITGAFNETIPAYDANGNITQLQRYYEGDKVDDLTYTYSDNTNQIQSITDDGNTNTSVEDYPGTSGTYTYDGNGNTNYDGGRDISLTFHPSLNLPLTVDFGNNNRIYYHYSASGAKQMKHVIDASNNLENTTQPFAIKILESIKRRKEEMAQGQAGQLPPEVMAEAQQQADPKTLQMMRQAVGRVV
jgi:hypothetical protein